MNGHAVATALVESGMEQDVLAVGHGTATVTNFTGTTTDIVTFAGNANASGSITNTGSVAVVANAVAAGNTASAYASAEYIAQQRIFAEAATSANATASLTNDGSMSLLVTAKATGTRAAFATASIETGSASM